MSDETTTTAETTPKTSRKSKSDKTPKPANGRNPIITIRSAGVPLVAWETPDPAATMRECEKAITDADPSPETPYIYCAWNIIQGLYGLNKEGKAYAAEVAPDGVIQTANPAECLALVAKKSVERVVLFFQAAHRFIDNESVAQGVWNLRDLFKARACTLVLLAPSIRLPSELQRDVVIISEALPTEDQLSVVLDLIVEQAKVPKVEGEERTLCVDTLLGLSIFEAEQAIAMSCRKSGLDRTLLWERKVKAVEQTQGLTVYRGRDKFESVGGLKNAKELIGATIRGKLNITCVLFIDEMDKSFSAARTDTSGTTQDQNKVLLSYMQDNDIAGSLFLGPPGTGKTALCKAAASEYGIPLIMLDLGAMKGSLVGQSEQSMREAIKVIHAISAGRALFIGACNQSENLPPELRRRFNYCSLFFDLPDEAERESAFKIWRERYKLTAEQCDWKPPHGWSGAEVKNCCLKAWAMDCKLSQAARSIVPIAVSASNTVESLRKTASNKYISASAPGLYVYQEGEETAASGRKMGNQ